MGFGTGEIVLIGELSCLWKCPNNEVSWFRNACPNPTHYSCIYRTFWLIHFNEMILTCIKVVPSEGYMWVWIHENVVIDPHISRLQTCIYIHEMDRCRFLYTNWGNASFVTANLFVGTSLIDCGHRWHVGRMIFKMLFNHLWNIKNTYHCVRGWNTCHLWNTRDVFASAANMKRESTELRLVNFKIGLIILLCFGMWDG